MFFQGKLIASPIPLGSEKNLTQAATFEVNIAFYMLTKIIRIDSNNDSVQTTLVQL